VARDGSLSNVRLVRDHMGSPGTGNGSPDGMEVDALGNIWCTARGGIWVLAPNGDVIGVIETPAVAGSLVWGGEDLRSLFVCTSTTMHVIKTKVGPAPIPFSGGAQ
jgi:gluconolactonase